MMMMMMMKQAPEKEQEQTQKEDARSGKRGVDYETKSDCESLRRRMRKLDEEWRLEEEWRAEAH